ncbi:immunoglobulin-like domain-containing protein [Paenibacillus sp. R14(2021)]|uniref:immunoglobulin-like domain-containing protein n=1 Tax=Paenibacillus sp. R14(2021) TaxID=2859228 RepID=UPI001C616536|nr:immunoglobulin-like domain-containing protein [Paenibacillus sp. R14(2021)]
MKKWAIVLLALSLFAFSSSTVWAHGNGNHDSGNHDNGKNNQLQACKEAQSRLNQVLMKTKNERTRAILKKMIAQFKAECEAGSSVSQQDVKKVADDKSALSIQFLGNDSANSVTLPVILPTAGKNGTSIQWTSSNPSVISNNGLTVNRSTQRDIAVDLTAVIRLNSASASKTFRVVVKGNYPQLTDSERVARDKAALSIVFGGSDNSGSVTQPFKELKSKGDNGSNITWLSSTPSVISSDGRTVNRPVNGNGDITVIFTAIIQSGSYSDVKIFTVTVKQALPDSQRVAADKAALQVDFGGSDSAVRVTRPLDSLTARGVNGSQITWTSSAPNVLSSDGKSLHRPAAGTGDSIVVLTAFLSSGAYSDVKVFILTVKPEYSAAEKVAADKSDLTVGFKDRDSASSVTQPLILPTQGYYGSTIVWYSSNPSVLSNNGTVLHRPSHGQGDTNITLTALINNSGAGDVRTFTVTVKQQ